MAKKQSPSTLLWFIRRKAYVPLSEIRRRFDLDGQDGAFFEEADGRGRVFVGLPIGTTAALEKLWRQGKIGLELSVEFNCQVLIGVYPMIPVREPHLDIAPRPPRRSVTEIAEADSYTQEPEQTLPAAE